MAGGDLERIFAALQAARVRYLVVGGVALVLHGHPRFTADLDLVLALDPPNVLAAVRALSELGYRPRAAVDAERFADAETRRRWIEDKRMIVFTLWSPDLPATEVDLFAEEPFPFDEAYARAMRADLGEVQATVASIADLIALKRRSGRPKDLGDVEVLLALARDGEGKP
jgi:hypothetical protein